TFGVVFFAHKDKRLVLASGDWFDTQFIIEFDDREIGLTFSLL
ncbi:11605_t:CDS:1, partial [Racocetra persica]